MEIGLKIKHLRRNKGDTQEQLANYLNVSFQAVSKWENGTAAPDISLLPKLSTYFGVTIDDLFTLNATSHLERIGNMLEQKRSITSHEETYAKELLLGLIEEKSHRAQAFGLLADLHNHRARSYREEAQAYAKKALEHAPEEKAHHVALVEACEGVCCDWNYSQHNDLITYYQQFCQTHSSYWRGNLYLMDHLIADGRLIEAEHVLKGLPEEAGFRKEWYAGRIAKARGDKFTAFTHFDRMVELEPENWMTWATRADEYARTTDYDKALADNQKALALQPQPRYIDMHECMAHLYERKGEPERAAQMWQDAIDLLKAEWQITFGEMVDRLRREKDRVLQHR